MQPDPNTEALADRISEAFGEPTLIPLEVKAVLWDINAESWERGVMFKGGIGTVAPSRPENPYRRPPLNLPTDPSVILAEVDDRLTEDKVLLFGPHHQKGSTWWSMNGSISVIPDEINSFEILWTEQQ